MDESVYGYRSQLYDRRSGSLWSRLCFGGKTYVRTADLNHFGTSGASEQTASSILPKTQVDDYRNLDIHLDMLDLNVVRSEDDHFYISYEAQSKMENLRLHTLWKMIH